MALRAEQWADRIGSQLGKSVEAIIEVGRLLVKAKAELVHGEWERMFTDRLIPFSRSTGNRLMLIAEHPVLSNRAHVHALPPAWGTLYELTKADRTKLKNALKDGVITPDMQRRDVKALLPLQKAHAAPRRTKPMPPRTAEPPPEMIGYRTPGSRLFAQIALLLSDQFDVLPPEDQAYVLDMLDQTLKELRATGPFQRMAKA
jgi:hypothetical protein